jgi:hypothetical protein
VVTIDDVMDHMLPKGWRRRLVSRAAMGGPSLEQPTDAPAGGA